MAVMDRKKKLWLKVMLASDSTNDGDQEWDGDIMSDSDTS